MRAPVGSPDTGGVSFGCGSLASPVSYCSEKALGLRSGSCGDSDGCRSAKHMIVLKIQEPGVGPIYARFLYSRCDVPPGMAEASTSVEQLGAWPFDDRYSRFLFPSARCPKRKTTKTSGRIYVSVSLPYADRCRTSFREFDITVPCFVESAVRTCFSCRPLVMYGYIAGPDLFPFLSRGMARPSIPEAWRQQVGALQKYVCPHPVRRDQRSRPICSAR